MAFNANVSIGKDASPLITVAAQGIFVISASGLATSITVTLASPTALKSKGIDASGTVTFALNTTGKAVSVTTPKIFGGLDGKTLVADAATYTVPAAPVLANGAVVPSGAYLLLAGTGNIAIKGFKLAGSFDVVVTSSLFRVDVNQMDLSVPIGSSTFTLKATGGLVFTTGDANGNHSGFAAGVSVTLPPGSTKAFPVRGSRWTGRSPSSSTPRTSIKSLARCPQRPALSRSTSMATS